MQVCLACIRVKSIHLSHFSPGIVLKTKDGAIVNFLDDCIEIDKQIIRLVGTKASYVYASIKKIGYLNVNDIVDDGILSKKEVTTSFEKLINANLIYRLENNVIEVADLLKNKSCNGKGIGNKKCDWCECNTFIIHEHHYPIEKQYGGKEIVRICPTCHQEFHYIAKSYSINN